MVDGCRIVEIFHVHHLRARLVAEGRKHGAVGARHCEKIIEHMIIKMQWIMIEYTAIRQSLFLWYSHNANSPLTYETIREHIVIISRMTGYDDDDIREYLENSFAKLIWDWGYAALIMGIRK